MNLAKKAKHGASKKQSLANEEPLFYIRFPTSSVRQANWARSSRSPRTFSGKSAAAKQSKICSFSS